MNIKYFCVVLAITAGSVFSQKMFIQENSGSNDELVLNAKPAVDKPCEGTPTVSYAGHTYHTLQIGDQCWLKENLNVGTQIKGALEQTSNGIIEKYCLDDKPANCDTYGGLYQWNEAMQNSKWEGAQGICPSGWHIPTFDELQNLTFQEGYSGNKLKSVGQGTGKGAGTNETGFSALLADARYSKDKFGTIGFGAYFWSSVENYNTGSGDEVSKHAYGLFLGGDSNFNTVFFYTKDHGLSVRCLKN